MPNPNSNVESVLIWFNVPIKYSQRQTNSNIGIFSRNDIDPNYKKYVRIHSIGSSKCIKNIFSICEEWNISYLVINSAFEVSKRWRNFFIRIYATNQTKQWWKYSNNTEIEPKLAVLFFIFCPFTWLRSALTVCFSALLFFSGPNSYSKSSFDSFLCIVVHIVWIYRVESVCPSCTLYTKGQKQYLLLQSFSLSSISVMVFLLYVSYYLEQRPREPSKIRVEVPMPNKGKNRKKSNEKNTKATHKTE